MKVVKKIVMIVFLILIAGCSSNKNEELVGISNEESKNELQVRVIIDQINIRKDSNTNSEKYGIVKKDSIFNVLDYKKDEKYIWIHIKTKNKIDGYIASEIGNPYVEFLNGEIDVESPKLLLLKDSISVKYREDITDDLIKSIIKVEDDSDVTTNYNIDYDKRVGNFKYRLTITATDSNNNSVSKNAIIEISNEKQLSDKRWITYDEVIIERKKYESICRKYNGTILNDYADCSGKYNGASWRRQSDGSLVIEMKGANIYQSGICCIYNAVNDTNNPDCYNGPDSVSYTMVEEKIKTDEINIFKFVSQYEKECVDATGYTFIDLSW